MVRRYRVERQAPDRRCVRFECVAPLLPVLEIPEVAFDACHVVQSEGPERGEALVSHLLGQTALLRPGISLRRLAQPHACLDRFFPRRSKADCWVGPQDACPPTIHKEPRALEGL